MNLSKLATGLTSQYSLSMYSTIATSNTPANGLRRKEVNVVDNALAAYLHDHQAGGVHAANLLKDIRDEHAGEPMGEFAGKILTEVEADRVTLKELADRIGAGSSGVKEIAGWMADKVSRLKLRHHEKDGRGMFETLEFLALGIYGKLLLWRALAVAAPSDSRLQGVDQKLAARALEQHQAVENKRIEFAIRLLPPR
jgi:hypothetical protein